MAWGMNQVPGSCRSREWRHEPSYGARDPYLAFAKTGVFDPEIRRLTASGKAADSVHEHGASLTPDRS